MELVMFAGPPVAIIAPDVDGKVRLTVVAVSGADTSVAPPRADCKINLPMIFLRSNN
jgi:hypothetical protein